MPCESCTGLTLIEVEVPLELGEKEAVHGPGVMPRRHQIITTLYRGVAKIVSYPLGRQ